MMGSEKQKGYVPASQVAYQRMLELLKKPFTGRVPPFSLEESEADQKRREADVEEEE